MPRTTNNCSETKVVGKSVEHFFIRIYFLTQHQLFIIANCIFQLILYKRDYITSFMPATNYSQLKFARSKRADRSRHGRFRTDRGRLGRERKFQPVIGADWGPDGFDRKFGGITPPFCGAFGSGKMSLRIRRRLRSALRYPYITFVPCSSNLKKKFYV